MGVPYAEVIGDPVAHSKSPLIHRFWLKKLGLTGDYRALRLPPPQLRHYLDSRRKDVFWRGCNVTAPLKKAAADLVGAPAGVCDFLGAVNCISRTPLSCLVGTNTDLAGIKEALKHVPLAGAKVCLIGAGGAALAAFCHLLREGVAEVAILVRDTDRAGKLKAIAGQTARVEVTAIEDAQEAMRGARLVINATPMGMNAGPVMAPVILESLHGGADSTAFDMVYAPEDTLFLRAAREAGMATVDGLAMLIGQAAPAFELFFAAPAPREHDGELRVLLVS